MMTTEAAIIANPVAGGGKGRVLAERAREYLHGRGLDVEIHWTAESGQSTGIARDLLSRGVKRIVGCGGDGTLNEIANALAYSDAALGLLPGGRGNDLCRALGIPRSLPQAADVFVEGQVRRIDLGKVGDRYFNSVAAIGFDAEVCRTVELGNIPFSGRATYVYAVLKTLRTYRSPRLKLTGDFGVVEGNIFLAATSNTPTYGGGFRITPPAKMDDGILHVCLIDELPTWRVLALLPCVYRGKHTKRPGVRILPTRRLSIESERELWIYADGERMTQTPAVIEVAHAALQVIGPR
jgi:diacylglycerol kinase (ATP)